MANEYTEVKKKPTEEQMSLDFEGLNKIEV